MNGSEEDNKVTVGIAFHDPYNMWPVLQKDLLAHLPLRNVTWRSPLSGSFITIDRLPVVFRKADSEHFKDTTHPFAWYRGAYEYIYILVCESLDTYKSENRQLIRDWIERNAGPNQAWLLLYLPMGSQSPDTYKKIYSKICSDFFHEKIGDRCAQINLFHSKVQGPAPGQQAQHAEQWSDLLSKLREGVVYTFQHRSTRYDTEIRKLDAHRGTASWDFAQLFLTKESLALMYQVMQLYGEALVQYEELEALMSFTPANIRDLLFHPRMAKRRSKRGGSTPRKTNAGNATAETEAKTEESDSQFPAEASGETQSAGDTAAETPQPSEPLHQDGVSHKRMETRTKFNMEDDIGDALVENVGEGKREDIKSLSVQANVDSPSPAPGQEPPTPEQPSLTPPVQFADATAWAESLSWEDEGKRVLSYNMSDIRKRVFLQQCTLPELQRYLFARQCFFLFKLCRPASVADKGKTFILETYKLLKVLYREMLADVWAIRATWEIVRVLRECLHELALDMERSDSDVQKHQHECSKPVSELISFSISRWLALGMTKELIDSPKKWAQWALRLTHSFSSWDSFRTDVPELVDRASQPRGRSPLARSDIPLRITDVEDLQETVSNLDLEVSHSLLSSADFEATYLLFQRILADHLYMAGRERFAYRVMNECVDVFLHSGDLQQARDLLRGMLFPSSGAGAGTSKRGFQNPFRRSRSSSRGNANQTSLTSGKTSAAMTGSEGLAQWKTIRAWLLRKLLLCERALENKHMYMLTSMYLLDSELAQHIPDALLQQIFEDVVTASQEKLADAEAAGLILPADQWFDIKLRSPSTSVTPLRKSVHDEQMLLPCWEEQVGRTIELEVDFISKLRGPIRVRDLTLTLQPLQQLLSSPVALQSYKESDDLKIKIADEVLITPGLQTLTCQFVPLLSGEFFPHRFSMTFGGQPLISLRRKDSADMQKLFRSSPLFVVRIPDGILRRDCETPSFTPIGGRDVMVLTLCTAKDETITSLTLSAAADFFSNQASCQISIQPTSCWTCECTSLTPCEASTIVTTDQGVVLSYIPSSTVVKVHVPYEVVPVAQQNDRSVPTSVVTFMNDFGDYNREASLVSTTLGWKLEGVIQKGRNSIEIDTSIPCEVVYAHPFHHSVNEPVTVRDSAFVQLFLRSTAPVPLTLIAMEVHNLPAGWQAVDIPTDFSEVCPALEPGDSTMLAVSFKYQPEAARLAAETSEVGVEDSARQEPTVVITYSRQALGAPGPPELFKYLISCDLPPIPSTGMPQPYVVSSSVNVLSLEHHGRQPLDRPIECEYTCILRLANTYIGDRSLGRAPALEFTLQPSALWVALGFTHTQLEISTMGGHSNKAGLQAAVREAIDDPSVLEIEMAFRTKMYPLQYGEMLMPLAKVGLRAADDIALEEYITPNQKISVYPPVELKAVAKSVSVPTVV